jgi:hypothetical protein
MVVVKEETLGGNAFLAIESTPGDEEEEGAVAVRKGMIALVPHPRTDRRNRICSLKDVNQ